jgi:lipopolysaccharide/colanic/teichoic acid biosynthesis glycosyltransferase
MAAETVVGLGLVPPTRLGRVAVCLIGRDELVSVEALLGDALTSATVFLLGDGTAPAMADQSSDGSQLRFVTDLGALSREDAPHIVLISDVPARMTREAVLIATELALRGAIVATVSAFVIDPIRPWLALPDRAVLSHLTGALDRGIPARRLQRLFDLVVATSALLIFAPVLALIALAIKLDSRGPIFFVQERLGRLCVPFGCIKFRTMHPGAEFAQRRGTGPAVLSPVTRVGRLLRKSRLDELPQLINVIRGEMAIIGPRPLVSREFYGFPAEIRDRSVVRPGLTGWAQVNGGQLLDVATKFSLDLWYIRHHTIRLDAQIILLTLRMMIRGERVGERAIKLAAADA